MIFIVIMDTCVIFTTYTFALYPQTGISRVRYRKGKSNKKIKICGNYFFKKEKENKVSCKSPKLPNAVWSVFRINQLGILSMYLYIFRNLPNSPWCIINNFVKCVA